MNGPGDGRGQGQGTPLVWVGIVLLAAALAGHLSAASSFYSSELAGSDEAAHLATGAMFHDYLRSGLGSNPIAFAAAYYARYPKVAIGHWPPAFYVAQAAWYSVFGASFGTARALQGVLTVLLTWCLYRRLRASVGAAAALPTIAGFLLLPMVIRLSASVMSEALLGLCLFEAIVAFGNALDGKPLRPAIAFAIWGALAVLVKGSAWALGIFVVLAPLFARRPDCFRRAWFWLSGTAIAMLGAPFYLYVNAKQVGYPVGAAASAQAVAAALSRMGMVQPSMWLGAAVSCLGLALVWRNPASGSGERIGLAAGAAWVISQILFQLLFGLTDEDRYYYPALPLMAVAAGSIVKRTQSWLAPRSALAAALIPALPLVAMAMSIPPNQELHGYRAAASSIPYRAGGTAVLVASNEVGDGELVAERLVGDPLRQGAVLRANRVLATSDWTGHNYKPLMLDAEEVRRYLHAVPIHYVMIDHPETGDRRTHMALLDQVFAAHPEEFVLTGKFPVTGQFGGPREVSVYRNVLDQDRRMGPIRVKFGAERGGRDVEYVPR